MKSIRQLYSIKLMAFVVITAGLASPLFFRGHASAATGGYPWSSAICVATGSTSGKCPDYEWSYRGATKNPNTGYYYYRNCTDYAAWKLVSSGVPLSKVSGLGNAGSWDNNASAKGLKVSTSPSVGSVGVDERYGHVVYVEKVSGTTLTISEYNWGSAGSYGTRSGTASKLGLSKFISFSVSVKPVTPKPSQTTSLKITSVKGMKFLGTDQLSINKKLTANQYIASQNTRHVLIMQSDGNLVQYGDGFKTIWNSSTAGNPGAYAAFQGDGNFVVYSKAGKPLWSSSVRSEASRIILQHDGNLVIYSTANKPLWATNKVIADKSSYVNSDKLKPGAQLKSNQYLRSSDKRYVLSMQSDGNLALYAPGYRRIWQTGTVGNPSARVMLQSDGNIVVYSSKNIPLWNTGTKKFVAHTVIQSDGNLVTYNTTKMPLWASGTDGKL